MQCRFQCKIALPSLDQPSALLRRVLSPALPASPCLVLLALLPPPRDAEGVVWRGYEPCILGLSTSLNSCEQLSEAARTDELLTVSDIKAKSPLFFLLFTPNVDKQHHQQGFFEAPYT